jgi:hypothetical protein
MQCCISFIVCSLDTSIGLLAKQNHTYGINFEGTLCLRFFVTGKNELDNFSNERAQLTFPLNYMLDLFTVRQAFIIVCLSIKKLSYKQRVPVLSARKLVDKICQGHNKVLSRLDNRSLALGIMAHISCIMLIRYVSDTYRCLLNPSPDPGLLVSGSGFRPRF